MLKSLGLAPDLVHRATAHEAIYQAVMRTSLRRSLQRRDAASREG